MPSRHRSHVPQPTCTSTPTRVPAGQSPVSLRTISPANSCPGTCGKRVIGNLPARIFWSVAHTIDARTRTSACPASSCGVGTLSTATSFGARKTTARIVVGITSAEPRRSIVLMAGAPSWFHDHFEGAIDPFVERAQGLAELRQLEVVRDELRRRDAAVGDERDDLFHRAPVRAHSVEIDLFEDDLLEVDRRGLLRDPGEGDAAALADHLDRLAHRVLRAGGIDGDVRAEAAGPLAHGRDRVAVVVVDRLEPERLSAVEPLPAAHDDDARRAEGLRAYRGEQAHATRADRDEDVTGLDARPLHRVERDRRGVAERRDVVRHPVRDAEDALDRLDDVFGVRTLRVVPVLPVPQLLAAVVEAQVVASGPAHSAIAAARVRRARDARAGRESELARDLPRFEDLA